MTLTQFTRMFLIAALTVLPASLARAQIRTATADQLNASLLAAAASPAAFRGIAAPAPAMAAILKPTAAITFSSSDAALPEAPSALLLMAEESASEKDRQAASSSARVAPLYAEDIPAGWIARPLNARDKAIIGLRDLYSPSTILGIFISTGYSQVLNGQPNYGTDSGAYGQRLGAAVLRDTSESIFTAAVFAPLLKEDPRYYVQGPRHSFVHRVVYAITRPLITRTDSGRSTLNGAELLGYASASALSYTYYPPINRNFKDTAATFGNSLGGSAIDDVVSEFIDQALQWVHLEKRP